MDHLERLEMEMKARNFAKTAKIGVLYEQNCGKAVVKYNF